MIVVTSWPLVAHAGPGHSWQAMVVVAGVALTGVLAAAALGRLSMARPDDLVVPLAVVAVVSSLAPVASHWLSDAIGVALPLGVIALVALLLAALTPLDVRLPAPLPMGAVALAVVAALMLSRPLTIALHPAADELPLADDSEVTIVAPTDGAALAAGRLLVEVAVSDGSIGPGDVPVEQLPADPEEAGHLAVAVQALDDDGAAVGTRQRVEVDYEQTCTVEAPCEQVSFPIEVQPGDHRLTVEFTRGDGNPFATPIRDEVTFTAE